MSFRKVALSGAVETLSAGVAGAAGVAEFDAAASLESGVADELPEVAPAPNCPARKTWAALASFDLMSWAGLVSVVEEVAADGVAADDAEDAEDAEDGDAADDVAEVDANALPVTVRVEVSALETWTFTAKPVQGGAAWPDASFTPKKR